MAMKKADMAKHRDDYLAKVSGAQIAESEGRLIDAISLAVDAWDDIEGMMKFRRKYENVEVERIDAIDLVLRIAPALLHFQSINQLESIIRIRRTIPKQMSVDLDAALADAKARLAAAHLLWNLLENRGGDGPSDSEKHLCKSILEQWRHIGLIRTATVDGAARVSFATRMDDVVRAKCPSCGAIGRAAKIKFLEEHTCPKCRNRVVFVLLSA